ncbi:VanZ family protein [Glutamicibacter sp.]|uniref:VanZ family protein n=1 Tax=Glutamicibacter sp. TaxID=1931995 RepID=UPI0028BDD21A|nr:VanZ family protein [Glutamicibacter sp.]
MTNAIRAFGWLIPWFLILVVIVLVAMLLINQVSKRADKRDLSGVIRLWLLVCWYIGVIMIAVIPESGLVRERFEGDAPNYSFIPFDGWFDQYGLNLAAVKESALNTLLFVPGMILTLWATRMSARAAFATVVGFGVLIEITQWITNWGRALTMTDILVYAIGAVIGWGIYKIAYRSVMVNDEEDKLSDAVSG